MNDAKCFSLGEGQFLEFSFALIGFRLPVGRARQLIMRFEGVGGPLAEPVIGSGHCEKLRRHHREEEENQPLSEHTKHDALPLGKPRHSTMRSTRSAIPSVLSRRT